MENNEVILFGKGEYGTKVWRIWSEEKTIHIEANGSHYTEDVPEGKAGRSVDEQIKLRIDARVRSKLDDGFKRTEAELGKVITNQLGRIKPMLATHLKDYKGVVKKDDFLQPKLDGHRCIIDANGAYSRAGRVIDTIPEIVESLSSIDHTLDGELYCHGVPLQTISSWAKRRQRDTLKLKYHVYDAYIPDMDFARRLEFLKRLDAENDFVKFVPTYRVDVFDGIPHAFSLFRNEGYEGAILRPRHGMYEAGKRSKTLIKIKRRFDEEFKCIDVIPSKWNWGILFLETKEGRIFKTPAPGTLQDKAEVLVNKDQYIGRYVTCEFAEWTKDRVPFHCVAMRWREDV